MLRNFVNFGGAVKSVFLGPFPLWTVHEVRIWPSFNQPPTRLWVATFARPSNDTDFVDQGEHVTPMDGLSVPSGAVTSFPFNFWLPVMFTLTPDRPYVGIMFDAQPGTGSVHLAMYGPSGQLVTSAKQLATQVPTSRQASRSPTPSASLATVRLGTP